MARLRLLAERIREIEASRRERLRQHPDEGTHPMIRMLAQIVGVGVETADLLVQEVLSRDLRDRRAVMRTASLRRPRRATCFNRMFEGCSANVCGAIVLNVEAITWRGHKISPPKAPQMGMGGLGG
jgi:hypothetical protein